MANLQNYDLSSLSNIPTTVDTGLNYMLWVHPYRSLLSKQVILTEPVTVNDTQAKIFTSNNSFLISKGDYLNFNGKILLVRENSLIKETETLLPISQSLFNIDADSFCITQSLIPVLSDSDSSFDMSSETLKTINENTGLWGNTVTIKRSLDLTFQGVLIASDRLAQIMNVRRQYYFEFRNPIYFNYRIGTYKGIAEGVISVLSEDMIQFKGELYANSKLDEWNVIETEANPRYCPSLGNYNINFNVVPIMDYVEYCPLDADSLYPIN